MLSLIVHGGAGNIVETERPAHESGLERALEAGWRLLGAGASAIEAVETAVRALEEDPTFNAGIGSALRTDGSVVMDASIMDGATRRAGAVAGIRRIRNPISLARYVLETSPHVFMIGEGAEELAAEAGLAIVDPRDLVTARETERLRRILSREHEEGPHGTVGAVARDRRGHIAAATSTGGAPGSLPGRVGDSPIIGAGTFADDRLGGVSCTGLGENILRVVLARETARRLGETRDAEAAARWAVEYLRDETGGSCGVICLSAAGVPGAAYNTRWMGSRSSRREGAE